MSDYNDGKWHGWNGGECPVHPETGVEWVTKRASGSGKAGAYSWGVDDHDSCIIRAFRVTKEYREPREFWAQQRFVASDEGSSFRWLECRSTAEGAVLFREVLP